MPGVEGQCTVYPPNDARSNARGGEAEEHWGDRIQIPDLDPFFAFGITSAGGRRIFET